jgi:hypothetical protein
LTALVNTESALVGLVSQQLQANPSPSAHLIRREARELNHIANTLANDLTQLANQGQGGSQLQQDQATLGQAQSQLEQILAQVSPGSGGTG